MKRILLFAVLFFTVTFVNAADFTSAQTGNWNSPATWTITSGTDGDGIPDAGDNVFIQSGFTVTTNADSTCINLTIGSSSSLVIAGFNFTVSGITSISGTLTHSSTLGTKRFDGLVTVNIGGTWTNTINENINFRGGLTNNGTFTAGTGSYTFTNNSQALNGNITISTLDTSVTLTNNGIFSVSTLLSGSGSLVNSSGSTLTVGGTGTNIMTITTLTNAGTMNVGGTGAITTALNNFTNTGTLNLNGTGAITRGITNNGTVNLESSGTITAFNNASGASVLQITAASPAITTLTATATNNTVNYNGANQFVIATTYSNLILSATGTKTAAGNLTVNGTLTTASGVTLNMVTNRLLGTLGTISNSGTIQTQNTSTTPIPTGKTWGGTLEFNGGAQTVSNGTYNNLILSGSGTKTFNNTITISNNLIINTDIVANLGAGFVHTVGTLSLGGHNQNSGSWGGTASSATNKSETFFGTTATGRINVGSTCTGVAITIAGPNLICKGASAAFTATTTYAVTPTYQWKVNGVNEGTNTASFTSTTLSNNDVVTCEVSSGALACLPSGSTAISNSITMSVSTLTGSATPSTVSSGANVGLATTIVPASYTATLLEEKFNNAGAPSGWTRTNASANPNPTLADWTLRPDGYFYDYGGTFEPFTFRSNDKTQFYLSNSAAKGTGATSTTLVTPAMNSTGYTSLSLEFYQFYDDYDTDDSASVEVSTNGTNWTALATYTSDQGTQNNFAKITINLNGYIGNSTLYVRFRYTANFDWFWAIDNVKITGNRPVTYTYSWSATPPGASAGLPSSAGSSSSANVNLTVNPTVTTDYVATATNSVTSCTVVSSPVRVTVTPAAPVGPGLQSFCQGDTVFDLVATGTDIQWYDSATGGLVLASTTALVNGTIYYGSQTVSGSESSTRLAVTATVNPLPTAPSVTKVDASCTVSTGSITITAPTGMNYSINGTDYTNTDGIFTSVAAGTYQVTARNAAGCISSATPVIINPSQLKTWTGTTSTDWHTASNWSPSGVPTDSDCVVIPNVTNDPIVTSTAYANTLTVQTGGLLIFENNSSLLQDPSSTTNSNSGEITYKRISSPMKNFDYTYWSSPVTGQNIVALSPNTLVDKYFRFSGSANDWVLYNNPTTSTMIPGVGYIIRTPKEGNPWPNGEIVSFPYSQPVAFKGTPNNGDYTFTAGANELNLIGNPYPSAIDADLFINANSGIINGALFFWTHNTAITNNQYTADDYATYTLTGSTGTGVGNLVPEWVDTDLDRVVDLPGEYSEKNGVAGMQTVEWTDANTNLILETNEWNDSNKNNIAETGEWIDLNNDGIVNCPTECLDANSNGNFDKGEWLDDGDLLFETGEWNDANFDKRLNLEVPQLSNKPEGKIAAGQSFFVESLPTPSATQFVFNNSMRVAGNNTQFFKQANTKKAAAVEKNRVWLNLTNSGGAFKQLLVGYITGATNDWDNLYDGPTFDGQEFVDFYSTNQGKNLTIQGRALPFVDTDVVPLGYRSTIAGSFDISIDNRDGALAGQEIWLEDKKTNTLHELSKGKYTFTAINGVENDRFVLKYTGKTLGTDDNEVADKSLIVSVKNKKITLTSSAEAITQVQLFDLLGRKVYDKSKINAQEWSISNLPSSEQTLIVKTTLANGSISNKKIIY